MTPEVTKEFLYYLYTDQVKNLRDHAFELLGASNKYNLPRLKALCEEAVCQDLDDAKVIDVAILAHQNLAENAKRFAIEEIVQNFSDVIKEDSWAKLVVEFPELLHEIHECLASRVSQLKRRSMRLMRE
jgi:speckle-type POZ protein